MQSGSTFGQKLALSFAVLVTLTVVITVISVYALNRVVQNKDHVIDVNATALTRAREIDSAAYRMSSAARGYWLTGDPELLHRMDQAQQLFQKSDEDLHRLVETDQGRQYLAAIDRANADFYTTLQQLNEQRRQGASADVMGRRMLSDALPRRNELERVTNAFSELEERRLNEGRERATRVAGTAITQVIIISLVLIGLAIVTALWLTRSVTSQIGAAVQDIQSSSTELQTASTQQATGAREQATAMTEITTTISELLASSRQIAESAQRVAAISAETASAAQAGDRVVHGAHDSVASIKRQVDAVVTHMLDLGRKSQQIGGIVDLINELAEQTNILAINANIEAAGAGESGRRFAVVADEIRKLADRVAGSSKDIRSLVDEVRAAVNTTVMATESGSKSVDAATRDFNDVTQSLSRIVSLVSTCTDAAHEIVLSTKQQSTAVEQINSAVSNVAQVSREVETSTGQTLQTASSLATLSRRLALLVRPQALA